MNLGDKILQLRKKNGLSQEQLGEKVDVTRQTISNWELGETTPNPEQLKKMSKAFNVSVDEILDNDSKEFFVGCYPLPTRYALTIGEFAQMVNAEQHFGCDLTVVPCTGWQRGQSAPAWGTPWIMPSPNIPNYETALLYVGTCLFEGTNVSEGRGTAAPFAVIGAPYIHDAEALAAAFNARGLPGICATPYYFTPTFSKHQGQLCGGVHLHVLDADAVRPLSAGLTLLELIRDTCPNDFALLPPHTEGGRPFISLLAGHRELERPDWTAAELIKAQAPDEAAFAARKAAYHLY